jgi:membrane associated rhomboid family serine protease
LRPADLFGQFAVWQPVTYMFVHGSVSHIFFNMLTLYFVGVELERLWGTPYFAKFYFACGLGAGFTQVLLGILPFSFADQFYYPSTVAPRAPSTACCWRSRSTTRPGRFSSFSSFRCRRVTS